MSSLQFYRYLKKQENTNANHVHPDPPLTLSISSYKNPSPKTKTARKLRKPVNVGGKTPSLSSNANALHLPQITTTTTIFIAVPEFVRFQDHCISPIVEAVRPPLTTVAPPADRRLDH